MIISYMYNYNQAKQKLLNTLRKESNSQKEQKWLKHYNSEVKPKLLQHYDARVNAFIKQIEERPQDQSKIITKHASANRIPFKFSIKQSRAVSGIKLKSSIINEKEQQSIRRASDYLPISKYQFRQRERAKQIPQKLNIKSIMYRRWKQQRHVILQKQVQNRQQKIDSSKLKTFHLNETQNLQKPFEDNRSDIPSISEGNISLRYSVNSQFDNIQKEAREYQKKQQIVQKKTHFKRLTNLELLINDRKAKQSIRNLLIKQGKAKPRINTEGQQVETDMLKQIIDKGTKSDYL